MSTNVFDRTKNGAINLDGRDGTLDGGGQQPGEDSYSLTLSIAPAQVQPGAAATVTVQARRNGQPVVGQSVSIFGSDSSVGPVPASVSTSTAGNAIFQIVGGDLGSTTISASMEIDGITYSSTPVVLSVSEQAAPDDFSATGLGQVTLVIESSLANAMAPRIQRLSHQEQTRKFPNDTGLKRLTMYETKELVFVPKALM